MTTATIIEEIIPMHFLPRGETGLPEHCFQSLYTLYINGNECSGAAELPSLVSIAKAVYDIDLSNTPVSETVFAGFTSPRRRR